MLGKYFFFTCFICCGTIGLAQPRFITDFNKQWKFSLVDDSSANKPGYDDSNWRTLDLPHDWSIEGSFSDKYPTTFNEAALPAGIGWYRKSFYIPLTSINKRIYINFDGVYKNSEVWINGHYLGKRPNGYISFRYELTVYLKFGSNANVIAVKVDNSAQPDSRWYSGSGIYRKVWLLTTNTIAIDQWGIFITTPIVKKDEAIISITRNIIESTGKPRKVSLTTDIYDANGKLVASIGLLTHFRFVINPSNTIITLHLKNPHLWSVDHPYLYKAISRRTRYVSVTPNFIRGKEP